MSNGEKTHLSEVIRNELEFKIKIFFLKSWKTKFKLVKDRRPAASENHSKRRNEKQRAFIKKLIARYRVRYYCNASKLGWRRAFTDDSCEKNSSRSS